MIRFYEWKRSLGVEERNRKLTNTLLVECNFTSFSPFVSGSSQSNYEYIAERFNNILQIWVACEWNQKQTKKSN